MSGRCFLRSVCRDVFVCSSVTFGLTELREFDGKLVKNRDGFKKGCTLHEDWKEKRNRREQENERARMMKLKSGK